MFILDWNNAIFVGFSLICLESLGFTIWSHNNIGIIHIYVYKYLIKNLQYFIKKLTIQLAGNIYGNNLKNTVALGMGQLLFLMRLRM